MGYQSRVHNRNPKVNRPCILAFEYLPILYYQYSESAKRYDLRQVFYRMRIDDLDLRQVFYRMRIDDSKNKIWLMSAG